MKGLITMAKIIMLYPTVTLYNEELDQHFSLTPTADPGKYTGPITIPKNTTDDDILWEFEAWAKEGTAAAFATGLKVQILQTYATEYEYYKVNSIGASHETIGPEGSTVVITVDFNDDLTGAADPDDDGDGDGDEDPDPDPGDPDE
jgi:hypothetical protein